MLQNRNLSICLFVTVIVMGLHVTGIFYPNSVICVEPKESTAPDFEVVFGEGKLKWNCPDSLNIYRFNYDEIWVNVTDTDEDDHESNYYFVTGIFNFKNTEVTGSKIWNPGLTVTRIYSIPWYYVPIYFLLLVVSLVWLLKSRRRLTH
jgi:hypothetical protein